MQFNSEHVKLASTAGSQSQCWHLVYSLFKIEGSFVLDFGRSQTQITVTCQLLQSMYFIVVLWLEAEELAFDSLGIKTLVYFQSTFVNSLVRV